MTNPPNQGNSSFETEPRSVLEVMQTVAHNQTLSELSYICRSQPIELRKDLNDLISANMAISSSSDRNGKFETTYGIAEFSRKYLSKFHAVEPSRQKDIIQRRKQLVGERDKQYINASNKYSVFTVEVDSLGDVVVAKYLTTALLACREQDFSSALENVERAKELAPTSFEVYRVLGWVSHRVGDANGAREAYEDAIRLNPASAKTRFFYAQFLLRAFDDVASAKAQLDVAHELDKSSSEVLLELARCDLYLGEFGRAAAFARSLALDIANGEWLRKKAYDLLLQASYRAADKLINEHRLADAIEHIEAFGRVFAEIPKELIDEKMLTRVEKLEGVAVFSLRGIGDVGSKLRIEAVVEQLEKANPKNASLILSAGEVSHLKREQLYGFIKSSDGFECHFRKMDLVDRVEWSDLIEGAKVRFYRGRTPQGYSARRVQLE